MIVKNVEKKENNTAIFQVETTAAEFEAAVQGAYLKSKKDIYIPGFRKGKAPRAVVEGMYGAEVFYQDAMDELAPKAFEQGMTEAELKIVGAPAITDVDVTEERTVVYTFEVTLYPEVTLGQYKGIEASKEAVVVTDEDVAAELEAVAKRSARIITVEDRAAQMGDTANIDFDGFLEGERFDGGKSEGYDLELGSNSFVPGFEEQVVGMSIGEEKDLDITFPEQYHEGLAGKAVVFKVKLNSLKAKELPAIDDEFAKDNGYDTLDEYKQEIRKEIEERRNNQVEANFRSAVMEIATGNMTVEIPEVMINDKVEETVRNYAANFGMSDRSMTMEQLCQMMGLTEEVLNISIRPNAEMQVKAELLLGAVVKAENIEVSDEEAEEYVKQIAENINATGEDMKQYFGMDFIKGEKLKEKATAVIMDSAVVVEAKAE